VVGFVATRQMRAASELIAVLALGGAGAALLAAAQLVPTLELARESARAGGLPFGEAASFSWRPWVIGRALLPTYGDPLFPEYVAYLGGVGLALALLGVSCPPSIYRSGWAVGLTLAIAGGVLALGLATPLFSLLYHGLPGFNLFRAQARWLVLMALGASLLVALGVERLQGGGFPLWRWAMGWLTLVAVLVTAIGLGIRLSPEPEYAALPERRVLVGWAGSLLAGSLVVAVGGVLASQQAKGARATLALALLLLAFELSLAAQFQPFARAADRQALTSLRPSTAFLIAHAAGGRILALSSLFFDPGDKTEQELIYSAQLSPDETYDRLIASKHKEILSPNLALYYRLNSVDGYDGGVLPTRRYADFVRRFADLPEGSADGRLREFLSGVPDEHWLDTMAVRYVIADKTQDAFFDGVYYDLLFAQPITQPHSFTLQRFPATGLGMVLSAEGSPVGAPIGQAEVRFTDGSTQTFVLRARESALPYFAVRLDWSGQRVAEAVTVASRHPQLVVRGLTSVDATDGSFLAQSVRRSLRLAHSGDVKVYERPHVVSRAELHFDDGEVRPVRVEDLSPEHMRFELPKLGAPATLVVRDACFPGWQATADDTPIEVRCHENLFRAVRVQPDARRVEMHYRPASLLVGIALSGVGGLAWLGLLTLPRVLARGRAKLLRTLRRDERG
ncbi:MAG: YfhO family protein, partial [Thermoflexales bacterium]|nr:YfhO family protein [Thermoflexales bacterium]